MILFIYDSECKTAIKNLVPNIKSVINPSEKIDVG